MIKARVLIPLNIRTGKPEILPNNNVGDRYYDVGDVVEIEQGVIGEAYKNNNLWYKLNDGGFAWSGGIEFSSLSTIPKNLLAGNPFTDIINYNEQAFNEIPLSVRNTKGSDVKIAIIDTGINHEHLCFNNNPNIHLLGNVTSSSFNIADKAGHGSHVAGLIGGRSTEKIGIIGIAPESQMIIIKGIDDDRSTSATNLNKALKLAIDSNVDIINLSLDIANARFNLIESEIKRAIDEGIIVVAAAGENTRLIEGGNIFCPANRNGIIAVGSCDPSFITSGQKFNAKINWVVPNYLFWSCFTTDKIYETERGSSMATALVTGLISLTISHLKRKERDEIVDFLNSCSLPISQFSSSKTSLLNPFK
jgi:subtilisin family serine protease